MTIAQKIKEFLKTNKETMIEASSIVGTGSFSGGRLDIKPARTALRQPNPFRRHVTQLTTSGSNVGFVMKTGNAGPNFRDFYPNLGNPNIGTAFWTLPIQLLSTSIPVRQAVLDDITDLEAEGLFYDLYQELEQSAAQSMVSNNDQGLVAGTAVTITGTGALSPTPYGFTYVYVATPTTFNVGQGARIAGATAPTALNGDYLVVAKDATTITVLYPTNPGPYSAGSLTVAPIVNWAQGGSSGLRGLNQYADASVGNATYGSTGAGPGNGLHTIATVTQATPGTLNYNDVTAVASALPAVYWEQAQTAWQIHPTTIQSLRQIKDSNGLPVFLEVGDDDGGAIGYMFGFPVHPNSYIDQSGVAGRYIIYLADWQSAMTIYDHVESVKLVGYEQTQPGFLNIYGELRLASSVVNPFAIVRLKSA